MGLFGNKKKVDFEAIIGKKVRKLGIPLDYLGGHPDIPLPINGGTLDLHEKGIKIGGILRQPGVILYDQIDCLEIDQKDTDKLVITFKTDQGIPMKVILKGKMGMANIALSEIYKRVHPS